MLKSNVLFILGPTASGKTAAALELAQQRDIEIISVDSALVFRGMDIGTAKPNAAELTAVPHHLIDIIEPTEVYSAAQFASDTNRLIDEISQRGKTPVLVGGTMLYVKALLEPLTNLPTADLIIRADIESRAAQIGWPAMHAILTEIDAVAAARLSPNDAQRIGRALEIFYASDKPMSEWLAEDTTTHELSFTPHLFALIPEPRSVLHERINQRFISMLENGFLDEVRELRARGDLNINMPAMRCVGYRQAWAFLDGEYNETELIARGQAATRQLAKRQLTWLRSMTNVQTIDPLTEDTLAILHAALPKYS